MAIASILRGVLSLLALVVLIDLSKGTLKIKPVTCKGVKLIKIGCYEDDQKKPRPLPELVITDRDSTSSVFSGIKINWKKWDTYMAGLICRCAQKSLKKKYSLIGLQHYGECWSGENSKTGNYLRAGPSPFCINAKAKKCQRGMDCIGEDHANFIYRVVKDKVVKPTTKPTNRPSTPKPTPPSTPKPTPPPTPKPTPPPTPKPTPPTTPKPTPPSTPRPSTPKPTPPTSKPPTTPGPTTASGTSTARPPNPPTQSPQPPCTLPAQVGCLPPPVQQCLYPPCLQPPPVPQITPQTAPFNPNGCGKSGIPCPGQVRNRVPSLDDELDDEDNDELKK